MQEQSASEARFFDHPLIRPHSLEERRYQREVAETCSKQNTLVVLPTGLGKTAIALLVLSDFLAKDPLSKVLVLAPTRVLVHQHYTFITKHLAVPSSEIGVLTGEDANEERENVWSKRVVCATPQVTVSDMQKQRCKVDDFALVVFDEVHRAVGNHAYSTIASVYNEFRRNGRVVGMTASLPSDKEKIEEIIAKLKIEKLEIRDDKSEDVKPYVYKTDIEWVELELSPALKSVQKLTRDALNMRLKMLEDASLLRRSNFGSVTLKDLLKLRLKVDQVQSSQLKNALFSSIRLFHALNLVETQSLSAYKKFIDRLLDRKKGYGMSELLNDQLVKEAYEQARGLLIADTEHPKISKVLELVERVKQGERAIIFASYRDTVDQIYSELTKNGFRAGYLIGKSGEGGQSQKQQLRSLEQLREGVYDILVATQVGEEGLDVAECNIVVFYDNVPSAVRFVQRKGRTGRRSAGKICVLVTKGTRDEAYYWMSKRRAGDAKKIATSLVEGKQRKGPLDQFVDGRDHENLPLVYADTREISELVDMLRGRGARVEVKQLEFGDFVVSSDVVIERKTLDDFVKSIFDGRLFKQLANLKEKYARPILVIQGEKKHLSGIGESAYYGALASVLADFGVPIYFAASEKEVVEIIFHLARREQMDKKKDTRIREGKKPATLAEVQRYIVSGIPGVSGVLADRLLSEMASVERLFSSSELDLMKVEGIGEVMARRIRELATAKYVSATPSEIKKIAALDSLEKFSSSNEDEGLDIPPPAED
ncbi:MAG: DEAD/DEAH box helicase [Nitrososphaerota archaeon]|nr:DEAD/DEAH box helicase [Nitrososphaerota archaeon]